MYSITRNNTTLSAIFDVIKRGDGEGDKFLRMEDVTKDNFEQVKEFFGLDYICALINAAERIYGRKVSDEATPEGGELDVEKAIQFFTERSTRTETKAELEELEKTKQAEFAKLVASMMQACASNPAAMIEFAPQVESINKELASIRASIERKSRERKPKTEATEVAAPA